MSDTSKSDSDVEVVHMHIWKHGADNLQLSKKRKKHSSKKKKKKKSRRQILDSTVEMVDLVSDSDSDKIEMQKEKDSRKNVSDSNKKSSVHDVHVSSINLIDCASESTSCGTVQYENIIKNKITEVLSEKQSIDEEEIRKYVGNISEVDFSDMEMDTEVSQEVSMPTKSQKTDSGKENIDCTQNTYNPNKFWPTHFDVEDGCALQTSNIKTLLKKQEEQNKSNAMVNLEGEGLVKKVDLANKITLTKSVPRNKFLSLKENTRNTNPLKPNLPLTIDANGNKVFRFFWWDAYESFQPPGIVYLFGKVHDEKKNDFKSCCVAVRNIPRRIYLLPRKYRIGAGPNELNTFENVYNEINQHLRNMNVNEFKFKKVTKKYSFEKKDVPKSATYYEVRYSACYPTVHPNFSSPAIQAVFETSMSPLELFLIEKKLQGPCWLDLKISEELNKNSSNTLFSWCEIEVNCSKMEDIVVTRYKTNLEIPPVIVAALYVQVSIDFQSNKKEIINVAVLLNHKFHLDKARVNPSFDQSYCLVTHPQKIDWPKSATDILTKNQQSKVICCKDELELLEKLLEILERSNPDILVCYDSKFQLEVLVNQITTWKVKDWSRIGKLKCFKSPHFKDQIYLDQLFCGRPFCDIQVIIKELNVKITNNDLESLCSTILHKEINKCKSIDPENCPSYYESVEKLENLVRSTKIKALYVLEIALELNALQLACEQTRIAGNTFSRTLAVGVWERNEYLLLHAFHDNDYVIPEKRKTKDDPNRKAAFLGGMILEPVQGFYDSLVLLMDFNSLYPNIIMEFNICFTTIPGAGYEDIVQLNSADVNLRRGILPIEVQKLTERRNQVKRFMQSQSSDDAKFQNNIKQLALKLIANSVYGCLGAPFSRFYSKGLAALIAIKGREILQKTTDVIQTLGYKVIYGDTDSVMIQTKLVKYEDAIALGKCIKKTVNESYKKIELDIDTVFKYLLLLKKKQYAGIKITKSAAGSLKFTKEIKGLEIIKRNYCSVASDTGNQVLDQILSDQDSEQRKNKILEILRTTRKKLQENLASLMSLEIVKQLSKDPSKYSSSQVSSHAIVAQRLNKNSARKWQAGDIISYVICKDATGRNAGERAYHITEITTNSALKIDADYYLSSQIFPVVSKICSPIEEISTQLIAETLGVHQSKSRNHQENQVSSSQKDRFEKCIPFEFYCQNEKCKTLNQVKSVLVEYSTGFQPSLAVCSNLMCDLPPFKYPHYIQNKLQMDIRKYISQYYKSELKCDSQLCLKVCKSVPLDLKSKYLVCNSCFDGGLHKIYKESDLFNQLCFFLHIFTLKESHLESLNQKQPDDLEDFYSKIREFVMNELDNSAYNLVDLTKLFNPANRANGLTESNTFENEDY